MLGPSNCITKQVNFTVHKFSELLKKEHNKVNINYIPAAKALNKPTKCISKLLKDNTVHILSKQQLEEETNSTKKSLGSRSVKEARRLLVVSHSGESQFSPYTEQIKWESISTAP